MSTRGLTIDDVGFIHCSTRDQVESTANRFYADVDQLVVLTIDQPAVGSPIRFEPPAAEQHRAVPAHLRAAAGRRGHRRHVLDPVGTRAGRSTDAARTAAVMPRPHRHARLVSRRTRSARAAGSVHRTACRRSCRGLAALPRAPPPPRRADRGCASRTGSRSPAAIAAWTAQPGSWSCLQSRNRQLSIRSNTSAKARSMPLPDSHRLSARTPGVSISQPSPGSGTSSAATVVWRPRWSPSRTAEVAWRSLPSSALTSVDLPTPLAPRNVRVRLPAA